MYPVGAKYDLLNGAVVFHRRNRSYDLIDLNPNQFSGRKALEDFLRLILKDGNLDEPVIVERHLNLDLNGYDTESITMEIAPTRLRRVYRFREHEVWNGGELRERVMSVWNSSTTFGSKNRRRIALYAAHKKHKHLPVPTTRIEERLRMEKEQRGMKLVELLDSLPALKPFSSLKFASYGRHPKLDAQDLHKLDYLRLAIDRFGYKVAIQRLRKRDQKYQRTFKRVLPCWSEREIDLNARYSANASAFLRRRPTTAERWMFERASERADRLETKQVPWAGRGHVHSMA
jgi:hypothetical protein